MNHSPAPLKRPLTLAQRRKLRALRTEHRRAYAAYQRTRSHRWAARMVELVKEILPLTVVPSRLREDRRCKTDHGRLQ